MTILFLHGILGEAKLWQPVIKALQAKLKSKGIEGVVLYSYTLSGFGQELEKQPQQVLDTTIHADELIHFCKQQRLENVIVVAWSYSCHVALLAALKEPILFAQLFLYEGIIPTYGLEEHPEKRERFTQDLKALMTPILRELRHNNLKEAANSFLLNTSNKTLSLLNSTPYNRAIFLNNLHTLPLLLSQADPPPISALKIKAMPQKIEVYWGEYSRDLFKIVSKILATLTMSREESLLFKEIKGAHHFTPVTQPILFAEILYQTVITNLFYKNDRL